MMGLYWPQFLSVKGYVCRKFNNNVGSHAAELILFWLQKYIESSRIQTFWIVAPADVVFTTSVGFDIFNCEVCRVFCFFCQVCILQRGPDHINVPMPVKGYDVRSTSCLNNNLGPQTLQSPFSLNCRVCGVVYGQCIFQQWCEDECAYARWRALMSFNACCLNHNADVVSSIIL